MFLKHFLKNRSRRQRSIFHGDHRLICQPQTLEAKALLAGNVTTQLVGQTLLVTGDAESNSVELLVEDGNIVARGLDGTTVDGNASDVTIGAANAIGRNLVINVGSGDDLVRITDVNVGGSVTAFGGSGNDTFALANVSVGRTAKIFGQAGNDLITTFGSTINRNLNVFAGIGSDDVVVDQTTVGRKSNIFGQSGDDDVVFRASQIQDDARFFGQSGTDIITLEDTNIGDRSLFLGGIGGDIIQLTGNSTFGGRIRAFGGPQADTLEIGNNVTTTSVRGRSFASDTADGALIDQRITNATTGAIAAAEAALNLAPAAGSLTLTVDNASVSEADGVGAATLTVTRTGETTDPVDVTIATSDARLTTQNTTVTIAAGQTTATVLLDVIDDTTVGNSATLQVTATAPDLTAASVNVTVNDDEQVGLMVTANPSTLAEDTGDTTDEGTTNSFELTIARSGDLTDEVVANLSASIPNEVVLPPTVTIPAGSASTTITVDTVADTVSEPDQQVEITAASPGFNAGSATITIQDTDTDTGDGDGDGDGQLTAVFDQPTIGENGSGTLTITRDAADTTAAVTVTLTSENPESLVFANAVTTTTVEIPAGQTTAQVTVFGVPEIIDDGDTTVTVTASAPGLASATQTTIVEDDDDAILTLQANGGTTVAEDGGSAARSATVSRNSGDTSAELVVNLSVTGDNRVSVPATVTIPAGETSVDFNIAAIDNNLVDGNANATITAAVDDFTSAEVTVFVIDDDDSTFSFSPGALTVVENDGPAGGTITLERTDASTAETVTLSYSDETALTGPASISFAIGETSQTISLDVIDNDSFGVNPDVLITASVAGQPDVTATVSIVNEDVLTNVLDVTTNDTVESVGALLTRDSSFIVNGTTTPGAEVELDIDGDGDFAEGATIADQNGNYSFTATLTNTDLNNGLHRIQTRASVDSQGAEALSAEQDVHFAIGTVVRFEINQDFDNSGENDFYDVELLDDDAPITVANFLEYVNNGSYEGLIVHRSPFNFVIQGGGFVTENGVVDAVPTLPPIQNEFNPDNSNVRGTLSTALIGGQPNSATSQWFVNVSPTNTFLDNALHTVFGRVLGDGLAVVDQINQLPIHNAAIPLGQSALGELPLTTTPFSPLQGTLGIIADSTTITGSGTAFTTELSVGDFIQIGAQSLQVTSIVSDTELTVDLEANNANSGLAASRFDPPTDDEFIVFSNIGEILDSM